VRISLVLDSKAPAAERDVEDTPSDLDLRLVQRFRAGEQRAFDELVRRYQRPIHSLCMRYLRNTADAADVTQRAFVKAFQSLDGFRGESSFRTWLYRIAINMSLNHIRDHKRERPAEIRDDALTRRATGPQRIISGEDADLLREAIAELPPKQRTVLELRVYDELSFREVAELVGSTENAAKVNFHHAVKKLRARLGGGEEEVNE
jgi:RNA polymerase sigma-70 factor (ECF subfamily)